MPIELACPQCGARLRLADEHAGRQGQCPQCRTTFRIPPPGEPTIAAPPSAAEEQWQMRTPDGQVWGPASRRDMDGWVSEGRVPTLAQLMRVGSGTWQPALDVYPTLGSGLGPRPAQPPMAAGNPYLSPQGHSYAGMYGGAGRPHRGGLILGLGIAGLIVPVCLPVSIAAWVMGAADLREIRVGAIDPSGQGLTQAGMILGIIGTVISGLGYIIGFFILALAGIG